ncbi:unnamed protein product [Vitrella brassicaformis CCMP3155]|uniref:Uncharacterized protein n=1 Tax=Vitrella brassicaformis (strain CCMP3155) TaxID=1169540 RepID=A0A0G4F0E0_VITBC|nr:unnamed protein product [Vitrella brassicaformis CCMP3155]|eukprot:CEM05188.1 unnamed protein product [Vitrella brassicaformis CCMP3155]
MDLAVADPETVPPKQQQPPPPPPRSIVAGPGSYSLKAWQAEFPWLGAATSEEDGQLVLFCSWCRAAHPQYLRNIKSAKPWTRGVTGKGSIHHAKMTRHDVSATHFNSAVEQFGPQLTGLPKEYAARIMQHNRDREQHKAERREKRRRESSPVGPVGGDSAAPEEMTRAARDRARAALAREQGINREVKPELKPPVPARWPDGSAAASAPRSLAPGVAAGRPVSPHSMSGAAMPMMPGDDVDRDGGGSSEQETGSSSKCDICGEEVGVGELGRHNAQSKDLHLSILKASNAFLQQRLTEMAQIAASQSSRASRTWRFKIPEIEKVIEMAPERAPIRFPFIAGGVEGLAVSFVPRRDSEYCGLFLWGPSDKHLSLRGSLYLGSTTGHPTNPASNTTDGNSSSNHTTPLCIILDKDFCPERTSWGQSHVCHHDEIPLYTDADGSLAVSVEIESLVVMRQADLGQGRSVMFLEERLELARRVGVGVSIWELGEEVHL